MIAANRASAFSPPDHEGQAQVLLVTMPFGYVLQPTLGISLLKAALSQRGIGCDIEYLSLRFVEHIGAQKYGWVAKSEPNYLFGEWLFAAALFERAGDNAGDYVDYLQARTGGAWPMHEIEAFIGRLRSLRDSVEPYLANCMTALPWDQYDIIGFTTSYQQNVASLALARRVKAAWPDKTIVFGGANCEGEMGLELHRQFPFIDYVCRGESDFLFPNLVERLLSGEDAPFLPGLVMRVDGESVPVGDGAPPVVNMDKLPYPDFDDYFRQLEGSSLNISEQVSVSFEASRGCWYGAKQHCTFCGLNGETMAYRSKSAARVIEELTFLHRRYGVKHINSMDNILDMGYFRDVIPTLAERKPDWSIFYEVKANLRKEQVRLLKQAGFDTLQPGIESLSTDILRLMRKGCTALQNVQLLKWATELGVRLEWVILMGFPGEDPAEYERMAGIIPSLIHLQPPGVPVYVALHRFSPYFNTPQQLGMTGVRAARSYAIVYPFAEEVLQRIAYHFDYEYADGRDPRSYTHELQEIVAYWRKNHAPGALVCVSGDDELAIYDHRPIAAQSRHTLTGADKAAYEICDEAHSLAVIHKQLVNMGLKIEVDALQDRLERLVDHRLMLRDGDWFLSLAVPASRALQTAADSDVIKRALVEAFVELGRTPKGEPAPA